MRDKSVSLQQVTTLVCYFAQQHMELDTCPHICMFETCTYSQSIAQHCVSKHMEPLLHAVYTNNIVSSLVQTDIELH